MRININFNEKEASENISKVLEEQRRNEIIEDIHFMLEELR